MTDGQKQWFKNLKVSHVYSQLSACGIPCSTQSRLEKSIGSGFESHWKAIFQMPTHKKTYTASSSIHQ